jgi:PAS domain S-box-containing protein
MLEKMFNTELNNDDISLQVKKLLELVEAFVMVIDTAGNIQLINRVGRDLMGYEEEELLGKDLSTYLAELDKPEQMQKFLASMVRGEPAPSGYQEVRFCTKENRTRILEVKYSPIPGKNRKIQWIFISGLDVTNQQKSTRKLHSSKEKAEHLQEKAEHQTQIKSEFLARVSHEIRTPLNAIMGFTEQLMQTKLDSQQMEFLKIIDKSSEHMLSLINDVLVIQKIEANELTFDKTPFKITYPIEYIYNALQEKAKEKKIRFTYHIDEKLSKMVLIGDPFRLRQILINMLNNAIKFTHQGYVELRCFISSELEKTVKVRFDIMDTGIGVSPANIDTIFEEFKQADSTITKRYGGTGLGLTICKRLIEMQHGSLSVTSQEGTGTTFTFTIPFVKGKKTEITPPDFGTVDSDKLRGTKVLLVDDDSVNRLLGKTILEKFNCSYDISNTGEEAVERLKHSKYDIILLDIHMADVSGLDVARFIRDERGDKSTRIIAVTAAIMQHDIKEFYTNGIDDFLIKPFKEVNLFKKMCDMLRIETEDVSPQHEEIILKEYDASKLYNLTGLEKMAGPDEDFMTQMLLTFINNTEHTIQILPQLVKEKNWDQIGETAHKILPSFRHLEVEGIVSKLLDLKAKTLIEPDYRSVPDLVRSTIEEMQQLVNELNDEMGQ